MQLLRNRRDPGWPGYGEPFNGQVVRQATIQSLLARFRPRSCIETGTFYGFTTRRLAELGVPVYSVEVNPGFLNVARVRLARHRNVTLIRGDSAEVLEQLARQGDITKPFVYLDAHWGDHLPLPDEVRIVFDAWSDALITIDDFLVPAEPNYGYDVYGGKPLALEILPIPHDAVAAYPSAAAERETGAKRGTIYLARGQDSAAAIHEAVERQDLTEASTAHV